MQYTPRRTSPPKCAARAESRSGDARHGTPNHNRRARAASAEAISPESRTSTFCRSRAFECAIRSSLRRVGDVANVAVDDDEAAHLARATAGTATPAARAT